MEVDFFDVSRIEKDFIALAALMILGKLETAAK